MTKEQRERLIQATLGTMQPELRDALRALLAAFDAAQRDGATAGPSAYSVPREPTEAMIADSLVSEIDDYFCDRASPRTPTTPIEKLLYRCRLAIAATSAQALPREPTEAMQRAMVDAMFDERGDLKWRELAKIARKGWRAAYDAAMPAKIDGGAKERLGLWQVQGYTATDAAQPPSAPAEDKP